MTVEIEQEPTTGINDAAPLDRSGEIAGFSQPEPDAAQSSTATAWFADEPRKSAANRIYVYAAAAVGFGILLGAVIAAIAWQRSSKHEVAQPGPVPSSADGLTGHLPTPSEQAEMLKRQSDLAAAAAAATADATAVPVVPAHRKKPKQKTPPDTVAFAIEGDDELVGFDTTRGIVETSTRKFFVVGKPIAADNSAAWQDIPADVHYKCDLSGMCSLRRKGAGILYAVWKR